MVKQLLAEDWLIDESPYLQRIREEGREEGRGEGREEGREEGSLLTRQRDILTVLTARFELSDAVRQQVEHHLATQTDEAALATLLRLAAQSPNLTAFLAAIR